VVVAGQLFPFHVLKEAGFDDYGPNVRHHIDRILALLANPCLGQRLRHPTGTPETEWRWDDFCKLDLPRQLRLLYRWDSDRPRITLVALGPHLAQGQLDNVYDALAELFDLPPDEGHTQLAAEPCCTVVDPAGRTVSLEEGRAQILRMAKR